MERMGTEYQRFNGKEYVSLRRFWNMEGKYKTEKAKNEELKEENKKLKEDNIFLTKISKEYMKKENIIEITEFTELYKDDLVEENRKLKDKIETLELWLDNKEKVNKSLREELKELEETLEHRDSVLSIMYDLLRSDLSDYEQLCMIDVVIDVEVGNEPQNKLGEELLDRFWKRDF